MDRRGRPVERVFPPSAHDDVQAELEFHLAERTDELRRGGVGDEQARAQAHAEFGPVEAVSSRCEEIESGQRRARRRRQVVEGGKLDLRDGLRQLRRRPWISGAVVAAVALAVATTVATISLVWSTLLRPLGLPAPDHVVAIHTIDARVEGAPRRGTAAPGDAIRWRSLASFEAVTTLNSGPVTMLEGDEPERLTALLASQDVARVLQVRAHLGRMFADQDWAAGSGSVMMVTYDYWLRALGADSSAVGRQVRFQGGSAELVGVLPPLPRLSPELQGDVWFPFDLNENPTHGGTWLRVIGRLRPDVTEAAAQAELDAAMARLAREEPATNALRTAWIEPLGAALTWSSRPALFFLTVAVGVVVLIAGANVAVLLLGVAADRSGEIALRAALGAGPGGLARLCLAESLVSTVLGAVLGFPLGAAAVRGFLSTYPGGLPRGEEVDAGPVAWASGAVLALLLAALGTIPQRGQTRRLDVARALLSGGRAGSDARAARFRTVLVVSQLALCTFLLTAGVVLIRVYREVVATPPGFESGELVAFNVTPPAARYQRQPDYLAFYDDLLARVRGHPGVSAASYTSLLPFDRDNWTEGMRPEGSSDAESPQLFVLLQRVEPSYTDVLGLPLLAGRRLSLDDREGAPRVGLINETLARRWFGGADAIGKRIGSGERWIEIVGVVGDKRHRDLSEEPLYELYVPRLQDTQPRSMWIVVRSAGEPGLVLPGLREVLRQADPAIAFAFASVMSEQIELSTAPERFRSLLLGSLAAAALLLATLGVWVLASFRVSRQTRDIGVRMALGLSPSGARAAVLRSALLTGGAGVLVGAALTLLGAKLVDTRVVGIPELDAWTLLAVPLFLLSLTTAAALRPAWRASTIDPIRTIRSS